ncbi:helix-turn-helix transcriptional regulator [Pseudonocardia halophobica]|uniref:Transcriptional regulator n=1 Tax=Pseudonocardia halophobica TaxID=29401 RepID=A0A9W6L0X1_9PSEU|nr:helix-turn-helix transcriptional regulator [Pseudonocardia halophobica]GLL11581.1 transcriptional regulator [Pseudonocardia halophobica]
MAPQQGPAGPRRRLGAELRRLRLNADMTLDEVAEKMTCSTSKISRLETGKGIPKLPDVNELIRIYGVTSDAEQDMLRRLVREGRTQGWWEPITEGVHPERFVLDAPARFAALETEAVEVRTFDNTVLLGLLQTERYARALMRALLPSHSDSEIELLVQLRMRRARALRRAEAPLRVRAVMDESVLCRLVGGAEVMAQQAEHLLELGNLPNVSIQVLPFEIGMHRALAGQFTVLRFADELAGDVVHIEGSAGDTYLEAPSDVDLYTKIFDDVAGVSLSPGDSAELIARYGARNSARGGGS